MEQTLSRLLALDMPWWELVLRAVAVYVCLLVLLRITAKRTLEQTTPFDLIVLVLLGTAVQNSLIGEDVSLLGGLLLAATLMLINAVTGRLATRFTAVDQKLEGKPRVLACNGMVFRQRLRQAAISDNEFASARRQAGIIRVSQIRLAVLETSGKISFFKRQGKQ